MLPPPKHISLFALLLVFFQSATAGIDPRLIENKGQWHDEVHYKALTNGGYFFIGENGVTVQQLEEGFFEQLHEFIQGNSDDRIGNTHTLKLNFVGANFDDYQGEGNLNRTENYYIGNDASKHATGVQSFQRAHYNDIYANIDLRFDIKEDRLKYEFVVAPSADPNEIEVRIDEAESINLTDGRLIFQTSVGEIYEEAPFAYQVDEHGRIERVECIYHLAGNTVTYEFPDGYDSSRELVIDPEISFSTYIGAFSDNFGFTASYDDEGNLYGGAIVFGNQYPIEGGPFQADYGGGIMDCGITKYNADGTDLIYSTFLGGLDNEAPHSLVSNDQGDLFVYGTTGSPNFPTTSGVFQAGFAGGLNDEGLGINYNQGTDIFIARISTDGGQLEAATFIGGSANDGLNTMPQAPPQPTVISPLPFNFGDRFRGEIILDNNGNVLVASVTGSADFPAANSFSTDFSSFLNGAIFSLTDDLTALNWSTSTGGGLFESAYGIQLGPDGTIYVTGGTSSSDLPGTANGADPVFGGDVDGFIMRIDEDGQSLLNTTYTGTALFDQTYFVQLDNDGNVYVIGQSRGDMPISDGIYSTPNSQQFIQKYDAELTTLEWSTQIGSGENKIDFSPSAFLVTNCFEIYVSGWGGTTNNFGLANGNTFNLPTTSDAFQSSTDGSDFYLMVLSENAEDLIYATYFGGSQSGEHVDGGTSRFDKNGTVYQAVCAGCGGFSDFPTQPNVWSQNNLSSNCNLAVFKFRLSSVSAEADVNFDSNPLCENQSVIFTNLSEDADSYFWDFGDGSNSDEFEPTHAYAEPGIYEVTLLAEDSEGCLGPDSTTIELEVLPSPEVEFDFENVPICSGEQFPVSATGADSYLWTPAGAFDDNTLANPVFIGDETTTIGLTGNTTCGSETIEITIEVGTVIVQLEEEILICPGESTQLNASGGVEYSWFPATFLNDTNIPNPTTSPETDVTYEVTVTSEQGCEGTGSVDIILLDGPPELSGETDYATCNSVPVELEVSGGENYTWTPEEGLSDPTISNPTANPSSATTYTVTSTNQCGSSSLDILVRTEAIDVSLITDSIGCFLTPIGVSASGGSTYRWTPENLFANPTAENTSVEISATTEISVIGFNEDGCFDVETQLIHVFPREPIYLGLDEIIPFGGEATIEAFSEFPIRWEDSPHLSCLDCRNPVASPPETSTFYATIETPDGCIETDSILVTVTGNIYVPNAFSPDGDGINDLFKAEGIDIVEFKMEIFDRWGELIFVSNSIEDGWNGSSPNNDYYAPSDMYPYRIVAREHTGEVFELSGMVTLIR